MDNFKDFPVYDPETKYTLFTTSFDELAFDQLRELAYFNVMSNIDVSARVRIKKSGSNSFRT